MNKKISKTILLLTLLFLLIGIANATNISNDTTSHDTTEKVAHKTQNTIKTVESSEHIVEKKTIKKENKNKTVKNEAKTYDVIDYNTLHSTLTSNTFDTLTIILNQTLTSQMRLRLMQQLNHLQ